MRTKSDSDQAVEKFRDGIVRALRKVFGAPTALAFAIREQFPHSHPSYWLLIERRFTEAYDIPEDEAVQAVRKGYSSPSAAMSAHVIKRRPYVGFEGQRKP